MKKTTLLIALSITTFVGNGQNLVHNRKFEGYWSCPTTLGQLNYTSFWFNPTGTTPDYYNSCSTNQAGVPNNAVGYQMAHSGAGYCGIVNYSDNLYWREYIEIQLSSPLIANSCYHFEMYWNLADVVKYTSDEMGVYFSNVAITCTSCAALPYQPQIENATGNMPDTMNWTLVSGNYTAIGGEHYIIIGNFKNDTNTTLVIVNPNANVGNGPEFYTYIDDVSLSLCTEIEEQNTNTEINIYPNPAKEELYIKNNSLSGKEKTEIIITDVSGRKMLQQIINNQSLINIKSFNAGIYFIEINNGKNIYRKNFIKEK